MVFRIPVRKDVTVFVPGGRPRADRDLLRGLRTEGPVLVAAHSTPALECGADAGPWTLLAPGHQAFYEAALAHAARVVSPLAEVSTFAEKARRELAELPPVANQDGHFAFCCVADSQYLPFFFALVENLRSVHRGSLEIHLLAVDSGVAPAVAAQYPELGIRLYTPQDVWTPAEWKRIARRPRNLQALSSKPRIFLKARQNSDAEALFLLDLDMYFFRSPARLNSAFGNGHTLFFPQWSDRFTWARLHGIFNSGMVGAKKGAEPFISWWSHACWISCELDVEQGRFGDQAFIDQAILYFDGIQIYRDFDEDVAPWNSRTLGLQWKESRWEVRGDRPVGSFHAAGPDDDGVFEQKYVLDQLVSVFSVIDDPAESAPLFRNCLEQQRRHWPALDRALRLRHLAAQRTPLPIAPTDAHWTRLALSSEGQWVLGALDKAHHLYGRLRGHGGAAGRETENDFWVQLQRTALFHPENL